MSGGILIKNIGKGVAGATAIATGQAGPAITLNGSATSQGAYSGSGWAHKVSVISAGDDHTKTATLTGEFYASTTAAATTTATLTLANAGTATTTLYALNITGIQLSAAAASSVTVGFTAPDDGVAIPVNFKDGSLYAVDFGGTFGGATVSLSKYSQPGDTYIAQGIGTNTAATINYECPINSRVIAVLTTGSTTTQAYVEALVIRKDR